MSGSQLSRRLIGLLIATVAVAALTAFASVAPAVMRKLVLFAVGFGLLSGMIIAWAAREYGVPRCLAIVVSTILIVAGLTFTALRSHQQLVAAQQEANRQNPDDLLGLSVLEQAAADDPELADMLERRRRELQPGFREYLATRVSSLGRWDQPWPAVFWGGELLLAVVAGGWIVLRGFRERPAESSNSDLPDPSLTEARD